MGRPTPEQVNAVGRLFAQLMAKREGQATQESVRAALDDVVRLFPAPDGEDNTDG